METLTEAITTGITFVVDDVAPARTRLKEESLYKSLERRSGRVFVSLPERERRVVANASFHPLIEAIHRAFAEHRPLTLSPDDIWLTIQQGFAHHVNENAECLRHQFVSHQGKRELVVEVESFPNDETWPDAIALWSASVREYIDPQLHAALVCNFSTTTPTIRTASEVALLDAFQRYFDYVILIGCGIPQITLKGTANDWHKIRQRIEFFTPYDLDRWLVRLCPILDKLVETAEGTPDIEFWHAIYKPAYAYLSEGVSGWITDLFPYLERQNKRFVNETLEYPRERWAIALKQFDGRGIAIEAFPTGLSSAPIQVQPEGRLLNLLAGFLGVTQDAATGTLAPLIGWSICEPAQIDTFWNACAARFPSQPPIEDNHRRDSIPAELVAFTHRFSELILFPESLFPWKLRLNGADCREGVIFAFGSGNLALAVNLSRSSHQDENWKQTIWLGTLQVTHHREDYGNDLVFEHDEYVLLKPSMLEGTALEVLERLISAEGDPSKF
ncbi:DUF4419 domain-containing protein [Armatimonas sp.]|uniref:DUF4419 domain-containing protein n=1 Tax=Armatimonas sp. TaxID=1872638 RepID=UPI00286D6302|nr:DUF4419 domain-containing protein [Armatimonas sp.]